MPDDRQHRPLLLGAFRRCVQNVVCIEPRPLRAAHDTRAAHRATHDALFGPWLDAILTPSVAGGVPPGLPETTGDAVMKAMWTLLPAPCVTMRAATAPRPDDARAVAPSRDPGIGPRR